MDADRRQAFHGVLFAILSYSAFGFLSPVGQILLVSMGPFTLNAIRTLAALPLFFLVFPRATTGQAIRSLRGRSAWILGAFWLGLTFVPYLASLKYLPPTITTLTVYLTPLVVAAWQILRLREAVSPLLYPAVALTLVGGYLATQGPGGVQLDKAGLLGLGLALLGVAGWSGYTIHLKILTRTQDGNALTLAAFATSGIAFSAGALLFEGFQVRFDDVTIPYLGLYVLFPGFLSFLFYAQSLKRTSATTVAMLIGIELVATAIVSWFLTNEVFTPMKVAGLGLTAVAVTVYLWDDQRRARAASGVPQAPV